MICNLESEIWAVVAKETNNFLTFGETYRCFSGWNRPTFGEVTVHIYVVDDNNKYYCYQKKECEELLDYICETPFNTEQKQLFINQFNVDNKSAVNGEKLLILTK